jgi:hypothetical protein
MVGKTLRIDEKRGNVEIKLFLRLNICYAGDEFLHKGKILYLT